MVLRRRTGTRSWVRAATATERVANVIVLAAWLLALLGPALVLGDVIDPLFRSAGAHADRGCPRRAQPRRRARRAAHDGRRVADGDRPGRPSGLVSTGVFATVRNPVYTTMIGMSLGVALLVPTIAGALGVVAAIAGLELQTRRVEEPYLRALHGEHVRALGCPRRALPARIGRLRPQKPSR